VAEDVDAVVEGVVENSVGSALHLDGLDGRERFRIPHRGRLATGEPVIRFGRHGRAARVGVGDFAGRGQRVEIEDRDARAFPSRARNVKFAAGFVGIDVIESACAANFGGLEDLIWTRGRLGECDGEQQGARESEEDEFSHDGLL
jgi:hypothetical protein